MRSPVDSDSSDSYATADLTKAAAIAGRLQRGLIPECPGCRRRLKAVNPNQSRWTWLRGPHTHRRDMTVWQMIRQHCGRPSIQSHTLDLCYVCAYARMRMCMLPDRAACMQHALWDYTIMNRVKEWDVSSQWQ